MTLQNEDNMKEVDLEKMTNLSTHEQYSYINNYVSHDVSRSSLSLEDKKIFSEVSAKLDKYYTKPTVALECYLALKNLIIQLNKPIEKCLFIEPSAGSGVFLNVISENKLGFDIAPTKESLFPIRKNDFLKDNLFDLLTPEEKNKQLVFIGNPPFGTKSSLAIAFINQAFKYANIVGFIVPHQFRKWSAQSKIDKSAHLVLDMDLPRNAFDFMGRDYKVRCCFQVWVLDTFSSTIEDLRIQEKPLSDHPDFDMYQYNRTPIAEKYFEYDWDFAVPRQGYHNYNIKIYDKEKCDRKRQWIFFKAKNEQTLKNLLVLDFDKLSKRNTGTPGFGKADVVEEYLLQFPHSL